MSYIIVKYAGGFPNGKARLYWACHPNTYTAQQVGVTAEKYVTRADAEPDLQKMKTFNPAVDYGIVEVEIETDRDMTRT